VSKKILVVAPYTFLPARSGGQKYIAQFLDALGQQARVTVISTAQDTGYTPSEHYRLLPVLPYSFFRYADVTLTATLIDLIERNHYDWICWEHPYYGWLARIIKEKTGIKTLLHTHNIEYQRFRSLRKLWWPLLERYERKTFQVADKIAFISKEDRQFAIQNWQINPVNCLEIPYGTLLKQCPTDKAACRAALVEKHTLDNQQTILFFNGSLDYAPNYSALKQLLKELMPRLQKEYPGRFALLICGKGLPKKDKDLHAYRALQVYYAGFVEDIERYFKGADLFLNPVTQGGGIKTKMIESIAYGTPVISFRSGAIGLDPVRAEEMLTICPDENWTEFTRQILEKAEQLQQKKPVTPADFYDYYQWDRVIEKMLGSLAN
jgi:glycosyltransferase involved in cell wall biosynthesis